MKKLSVFLALLLVLSLLAGCTNPAPTEPETTAPQAEPSDSPAQPEEPADATESDLNPGESTASDIPDDGEATASDLAFRFTRENFPRMDGSTSLVPLGEALASVLLGETREQVNDLVQWNRTTQSYRNLMNGQCDLLLASVPNASVYDELAEAGFEIDQEEICTEALVFMVNEDNPVDSLTTEQLRDIYTGKITNWSQVGGNDAEIIPFQRNEGAGSQALMRKLVMGDTPMMEAPADFIVESMGGLIESVKSYDNSANALGYTVYYYAHDMEMAKGLKLLKIDGVEPNKNTIRAHEYPHLSSYYCVIPASAPEGSPNRLIYDWIMSDDGQKLLDMEGYVAVREVVRG